MKRSGATGESLNQALRWCCEAVFLSTNLNKTQRIEAAVVHQNEAGSGHSVTALYEIIPEGVETRLQHVDPLRYQSRDTTSAAATTELFTLKLRYKSPDGAKSSMVAKSVLDKEIDSVSDNTRFAAAVAEFGMFLRDSKLKGHSSFENCLNLARESIAEDPEGYRTELVTLVEKTAELKRRT